MKNFQPTLIALSLAIAFPVAHAQNAAETTLEPIVVTAPTMGQPLTIVTDPKAPRQPIPAHDGAEILKTIPGFNVIRKAGTDGDPVLRGMAGSRLNILLDGENILGGCGGRMDPPTAYVFPESYDKLTVLKGPQTVLHGPGNSAGTVLFERTVKRFANGGADFNGSLTAGSFNRIDAVGDLQAGVGAFYARATVTNTRSDDYKDGEGKKVHSNYARWSSNAALGWSPDDKTKVEFSAARSDGEAAYADRTMDGIKFDRQNYGFKLDKRGISALVDRIEAQAYYNYVDHVMDNYTLRTGTTTAGRMVSNPDRLTYGGKFITTLRLAEPTQLKLGLDLQTNEHSLRTAMGAMANTYNTKSRSKDGLFRQLGLFGELNHYLSGESRLIAGLRTDQWQAEDQRTTVVTKGQNRKETLTSGFARYEYDLGTTTTLYAGLGHTERFPDYWELIGGSKQSATTDSAFNTKPEKTNQIDIGTIYRSGPLSLTASGFYSDVKDFILIQSNYMKSGTATTITRNVDATTWGGELGMAYQLAPAWKTDFSLAYVRGSNKTDHTSLAQMSPLEARLGLTWDNQTWTVGGLLRSVMAQKSYALNQGNIVGQDIGQTGGFTVFSINGGYRIKKGVQITGGIDNVFNRKYAEHLSRAGAAVSGYTQTTRVNEPGTTAWVKAQFAF